MIDNIASMNDALRQRITAAGMQFDCGSGGLFNAEIAIVAEAPGDRETEQRIPLIGGSGRVLWDALRRERITRNQVYSTNLVKRRLLSLAESHGNAKSPVGGGELEHWRAILLDELSHLPNLRYIVALGSLALHALTGEGAITRRRGYVTTCHIGAQTYSVLATYNPAFIIREPKLALTFSMDMRKLTRLVNGTYAPPTFAELINPTPSEALDYIAHCRHSQLPVSYDIEFMAQETACVGLACSVTEGMCINFRDQLSNRWQVEEETAVRLALQELFADHRVRFVAQNGNFDSYWLWYKDRIRVHANWFDTMLAHHCLYPPIPHNLGYITSQYTDIPYYKDDIDEWREEGDINTFWRYNVKDCVATLMAQKALHTELREQGLERFFFDHVMKLQPHLVRMTVGGIKCDAQLKQRFTEELAEQLVGKRSEFADQCRIATGVPDYDCNPNSTNQISKLLFEDLRLVGRGTSTDDENRTRMLSHPRTTEAARRCIQLLNSYKTDHKFYSSYANATIDDDGRFRCEYKQTGVQSAPGRLSSSQTMWGSGLNLQNIPELAKGMFVCDDGWEMNYFDASQIEARLVGWMANIQRWKEQFELARLNPGSYDAHCALASDMFKVPYEQVPKSDFTPEGVRTIRYVAKRCRHGLNYRMGPDRLATAAGLSLSEAHEAHRAYHRETPELVQWWAALTREVRETGRLFSPLGRRWLLMQRFDDEALESIVAFKPQSTAGDKIASVIYQAERDPRWPADARVILNIHDALVWINRQEHGPLTRAIMKQYMEAPVIINGEPLILPCEFKVSYPDNEGKHRWSTLGKVPASVRLDYSGSIESPRY